MSVDKGGSGMNCTQCGKALESNKEELIFDGIPYAVWIRVFSSHEALIARQCMACAKKDYHACQQCRWAVLIWGV